MSIDAEIRYMCRDDLCEVQGIDTGEFWTQNGFLIRLRRRNCLGIVADYDSTVVGFAVYELYRDYLKVLKLAVAENHHRQGIGRKLLDRLFRQRTGVVLDVSETNLPAQLFLRSTGFKATGIHENAIHFEYWCESTALRV